MASTKTETVRTPDVAVTFHDANGVEVRIDQRPALMQLRYADGMTDHVELSDLGWDRGHADDSLSSIMLACAWHGAKQKLIDAAAISRDPATGRAASVAYKREQVTEVLERMRAGQWFKARGDGGNSGGLLFRALCEYYAGRKTPEEVRAFLDTKDDAWQAATRRSPQIAPIIERLRPQPKAADVDVSADLDEFGNE